MIDKIAGTLILGAIFGCVVGIIVSVFFVVPVIDMVLK